jgi:hypothetical protein
MKKLFFGLFLAVMAAMAYPVFAEDNTAVTPAATAPVTNAGGHLFWGVGAVVAPTLYGFGSAYNPGVGLNAHIGFTLDKNWALFAALDSESFSTNNAFGLSTLQTSLMPEVKYTFDVRYYKPYLFAGVGLNDNLFNEISGGSISTVSLAYDAGLGVAFPLEQGLDLQIQVEYEIVFVVNDSYSYLPVSAGLEFN